MPPSRKSMGQRDVPRGGDFQLLDQVRIRTVRMLKSTINVVNKLDMNESISNLTILKEELDTKWREYLTAFEEHESALIGAGELTLAEQITTEYTQHNTLQLKAKMYVCNLIRLSQEDVLSTPDHSQRQNHESNSNPIIKLAPMRITPFSGNLVDWIEFKATCKAVLVNSVPEIQRLQQLKDALLGEARTLVSHILPGDGAYDKAMQLLKDRYENTRAIVNGHFRRLYALPTIETPTSNAFRIMLNTINGLKAALDCCEINTSSWDAILVFHLTQRFDKATLALWEEKLDGERTVPTLEVLLKFLGTRMTVLETTEAASSMDGQTERTLKPFVKLQPTQKTPNEVKRSNERFKTFLTLKASYQCAFCDKNHLPSRCTEHPHMTVKDRQMVIHTKKLCANCFYPHLVDECPFEPACKKCRESHHTLLHVDNKQMFLTSTNNETQEEPHHDNSDTLSEISAQHFYHINDECDDDTLLATALVPARSNGRSVLTKSLIDQGSTTNLITMRICALLKLKIIRIKTSMLGVGNTPVGNAIGKTVLEIGSIHDERYKLVIRAIVVRSIGDIRGFDKKIIQEWPHLIGLKLADANFHESCKIDLLLGGSAHGDFILDGVLKGERFQPIAQNSKLGWFISGSANLSNECRDLCRYVACENLAKPETDLNCQLKAFWELEEVEHKKILTVEEQMAETVFKQSIQRTKSGNFIVDLPFKLNPFERLGESFPSALRRYKSTQRRLDKNPQLKAQYDAVLEEYLTLNHMELVTDTPSFQCFLPHHAVVKESSTTTKVRTVFDASMKTSSGISLNECLCVGPVIQSELFDLLLSWCKYEFALSSDIEKMYRMMYINREHADLHSILWHRPGTDGIATYRLLTVTFGTSSAPFQATRGIHEVGEIIKTSDSELADIIQKCFYVDDFLKSFPTIEMASEVRKKLSETLNEYGFKLRKWKSNDQRVLDGVEEIDREASIDFDSTFKTLGISWQANIDSFVFKPLKIDITKTWTKRQVLSAIAQLFDPLGWIAPCIVRAKVLMQDIWRLPIGTTWDSELPNHIIVPWTKIVNELTAPIPIAIPRWLKLSNRNERVEIHAFCDASNQAYGCCIYLRVTHDDNRISCNLITSKTKVAPVRAITIPRLELCGAVLSAKLTARCVQALNLNDAQITTWCDSKIVLAWLATHPSKWTTFVTNRVSDIQQITNSSQWMHIPSKQNPADIASRGSSVTDLKASTMWWHGPTFLSDTSEPTPKQNSNLPVDTAPEKRKIIQTFHTTVFRDNYVLQRFERLSKLLHFTCLAFRWLNIAKKRNTHHGPITAVEFEIAQTHWIRLTQRNYFGHEIGRLKEKRNLPNRSQLLKLTPFLDELGLLRMNGRVNNDEYAQQKISIILPSTSKFVLLLIRQAHEIQTLHGGVQLTLRALRQQFWIIQARRQVTKLIGHCIVCYRTKKLLLKQQMAELPSFRTQQARPFTFVGCDYAGPFHTKLNHSRNAKTSKGYIAVFICLTTKAMHLELVPDMTTAEFVMSLENFIARRGIPTTIYTDNGTNLVGAESEVHRLHDEMLSQTNALTRMLASKRITFKRIPARASHMAGIWERAVGLVKYHLKRILKDTKVPARQFDYVLKQIECCLNSRPLWALTPNNDDIEVITPAHFFNFQPLNTLPRPDLGHIVMNRLDQYQYLYRLYTDFWKSWSREYLDQLQPRHKWNERKQNISVGQIVVISEDNLPPSKWSLGRITAVYPAKDGLIRVVDVKCGNSTLKRPIHRLGILPILENKTLNDSDSDQFNAGEDVVDI